MRAIVFEISEVIKVEESSCAYHVPNCDPLLRTGEIRDITKTEELVKKGTCEKPLPSLPGGSKGYSLRLSPLRL